MNNILAAKVLLSHLPEITDGAYKTATEIAIENLFLDAMMDWHKSETELSAIEYLGLTEEEYTYWILGERDRKEILEVDIKQVKHGKWFLLDECANEGVYCSVCHKKVYKTDYANQKIKSKYCPNCGARMDG